MSAPVEVLLERLERVTRNGTGWTARCPAHEDKNPSLSVSEGDEGRVLVHCHAGCEPEAIVAAIGLTLADLFPPNDRPVDPRAPVATYDYVDDGGHLLFQVCRFEGKRFSQRRPDPDRSGQWLWDLKGVERVLYHLPEIREAALRGERIYICEGEKDADAIRRAGGKATCNPMGAGKWRDEYAETLDGADVVVVADNDPPGLEHAYRVAASLERRSGVPVPVVVPVAGNDAFDHLAAGHGLDEFVPVPAAAAQVHAHEGSVSTTLDQVLRLVGSYLDLEPGEDLYVLGALCGAVASTLRNEEPLWTMLVGAPGGGKTEAIRLLDSVVDQRVDELTRAGLLSWSVGKSARRVGLLTRIPPEALVTISDFSTVVTMGDREARARMFAMLRVVYDGSVYRSIGGEPASEGKAAELEWKGHLTLVAAATPAIDTHTSFEGSLGERWLMVRLPESSPARRRARARFVASRPEIPELRTAAQKAAEQLVAEARRRIPERLSDDTIDLLVDVATFTATARTGVTFEGQGKGRVVAAIPSPEEPTRLMGQLVRLARCAVALGLDDQAAGNFAAARAVDSVPIARMRALRAVAEAQNGARVADVHRAVGRGNWYAAKWELDALEALRLVEVVGPDESAMWHLESEWHDLYESVACSLSHSLNKRSTS